MSSSSTARYTVWIELDTPASASHSHSHSHSSSTPAHIPSDIFAPLPRHAPVTQPEPEPGWQVHDSKQKQKHRHRRRPPPPLPAPTSASAPAQGGTAQAHPDWRHGPIHVDWFDCPPPMPDREKTFTLTTTTTTTTSPSPPESGTTTLPSGTLHLFRHPTAPPLPADDPTDGPLLGILALPAYFTPSDLLDFLSPLLAPPQNALAHIRVLRDSFPDRSLVLLKFRPSPDAAHAAAEFTQLHNGRPFQDASPELCRLVAIDSVLITPTPSAQPPEAHPPAPRQVLTGLELPTCPVCLDRMDSALTGLITVPCTHTFHCFCLSRWPDSRCPVCRASAAPSSLPLREADLASSVRGALPAPGAEGGGHCAQCSATSSLWICLICGNLGCGRYAQAHAAQHYQRTQHAFALELETQRVWDYAGDTYVHRLIRNRADGKVVELSSGLMAGSAGAGDQGAPGAGAGAGEGKGKGPGQEDAQVAEKMEAMGVEYGLLLSAQLETQRTWYEERIDEVERRLVDVLQGSERAERERRGEEHRLELERLDALLAGERAARERAERKAHTAAELARAVQRELAAEQAVSRGLMENLAAAKGREEQHAREREEWAGRMSELEDQLRDVMIFLEARGKIESGQIGEDVQGGTVELPPAASAPQGHAQEGTPAKNGAGAGKKKRTPKR
ncbi:zf-UBP-domain-containing protein [Calocera cornea HHB12733]|uniref:Zf-UBP-domain-containing protein n=1 Tax=Calocera cornea HHB12733 TaxID=1353952 RepID=A0A165DRU5_9BASI|nr:zf-UBP-domain-containing protein [Calocera cornea HHB12733]